IGKIKNSIKDREEALQKAVSAKEVQEQIGKELAKANSQLKTEITERMRAEEKVRESLARFAGILDTAHEAIISIDETQRIINFNKGAEQIFGYAPDEAVGQSLDTLIPEKFHASHRSYVAEFAGCGKTAYRKGERREIIGCRKDGAEFPAEASISKLEVSGKKILTVVLRDVTERKRAEKEKSELETRLRQSQKMEAIGTLAGGIAHDFNNILWVILGNAEMGLRKLSEDSVVRDKLQEILTASKRAKELVEQILTFSRQEEQECKPVQIHFIVKEALRLLQASLPSTIEIRQDIRDCGAVLADPSQIHQVIMNLGTNAYQAMGELGGLLEVSMEVVDLDAKSIKSYPELQIGRFVEMTIRDTGCGMDPTTAERIFDPYFTTKGVGEGTGMGLATVHGIVTGLGGAIKVNSEPGKGSTFRVFLPRHDGSISEESEVERETSELRGNEHILVVDDEEQVVTMLGDMLEELGYEVTTETSSVEVLRQFQAHSDRFDLVITDRTMPRMTGLELAEEMVRIRPDIPIILATGFSKIVTEDKIKHSGIRECLKKPIVFHDLEDAIRRALDGKE
ncbi:MAG: PAS domain S-box protein, partial [bacterium]